MSSLRQLIQRLKKIIPPCLRIRVDPDHPMVILKSAIEWNLLIAIAVKHRNRRVKNAAGRKPHRRIMLGAVIVYILESRSLRKTADLIRHYAPARYLCALGPLRWNPNFRSLHDFLLMLGPEGLKEINDYLLQVARQAGLADMRGLCSDTTAQEARIPYPTEVGLMNSFARSVRSTLRRLADVPSALRKNIRYRTEVIAAQVRRHRLFCKGRAEKQQVEKQLLAFASALCRQIDIALKKIGHFKSNLHGQQQKAQNRLRRLVEVFRKLEPQIAYYLRRHTAAPDKIISLFQPLLRAIVRGKAGKAVEFGLKWGINQIRGGYVSLYFLTAKAAEPAYAVAGVQEHIRLFGQAPRDFGYDRGGWSADHLATIKKMGVRNIAVAPKGKAAWRVSVACRRRMVRERAQVEGKIGTLKMYGFNRPLEKTEPGMHRAAFRSVIRFNLTKMYGDLMARMKK